MSALGQKRSFAAGPSNVRFAPIAVINDGGNLVIAIDWSARPLQGPNRGDPAALKLKVDDAALQG